MVLADDAPQWKLDPVEQARAACEGGARVVQLRAKCAADSTALEWAEAIRALTREFGAAFFVNDRFDLALAAGADGVHLGQEDIPPSRIPAAARSRLLIGRSTHSLAQAREASEDAVDYIAFGPIFATGSKDSPHEPRGVERLAEVVRAVQPRPVIAIGGIDLGNVARVIEAGAAGVAVISAIAAATDPRAAARALAEAVRERGAA
ncbi:MAG: thiamine phosphate synthase [Deltaproteobacteria bacterium]|nr:thiamine phosphate synthase [Deltaproteobacteria bacterium]